jgi:hypothetical protein
VHSRLHHRTLNISPGQGVTTQLAFEAAALLADGIGGDRIRATCYFKAMLGKDAAGTVRFEHIK